MKGSEDRFITVTLTESQYSGLSEIFRGAKIRVEQAPLATEIMDALITTARVVRPEEDDDGEIRLGNFHPFQGPTLQPETEDEEEEESPDA